MSNSNIAAPVDGRPPEQFGASSSILLFVVAAIGFVGPLIWNYYRPAGNGLDVVGHQIGRDFLNTWAGPQLAFSGKVGMLYDLLAYDTAVHKMFGPALEAHPDLNYNFSYPPSSLAMFWPLGQMPYFPALIVWTIATFAALAFVTLNESPRERKLLSLGLLILAPGCLINALSGQNGFLSGALLIGGMMMLDRRPILAGVLFGVLTFKPHLGLVIAFVLLVLRCWRTIAAAIMTASLMVAVSVMLFGTEPWIEYLTVTRQLQLSLLVQWQSFYVYMSVTWLGALRSMGVPYETAMTIQGAITVAVISTTCWAVLQTKDAAKRTLLVASATPLALPYAFCYDLTTLSACMVWIVVGRLQLNSTSRMPVLLCWLSPVISINALHSLAAAPATITAMFALAVMAAAQDRVVATDNLSVGAAEPRTT